MPTDPFADLIPEKQDPFADLIPSDDLALVDNPGFGFGEVSPAPVLDPFADLIPKKSPDFRGGLESPSALGRIAEATGKQAKESFADVGLDENQIMGLNEFSDTVFGPPEFEVLGVKMANPLNLAGKFSVVAAAEAGETAFEGLFATFETALSTAGQIMVESGVEKNTAREIVRNTIPLMLANAGGGVAPRVGVPRPRARTQRPAEAEILAPEGPAEPLLLEGPGRQIIESAAQGKRLTPGQISAAAKAIDDGIVEARSKTRQQSFDVEPLRDPKKTTTPLGDAFVRNSPQTRNLGPREQRAAAHKVENDLQNAMLKMGTPEAKAFTQNLKWWDRQLTNFLDEILPIKHVALEAGRKLNRQPDFTPFREMRLLNGRRGVLQALHERGTIARAKNGDIVFNGKGFNEIFAPLTGKLPRAVAYFTGRRAQELMSQGRENLFTRNEIRALLDVGADKPLFDAAFKEYQAFNVRVLNFAVQSNLLSREGARLMQEANRNYVPFHRVFEDTGIAKPRGSVFRKLKGGTENLRDVFDNMVANPSRIIDQSLINDAKLRVFKTIDEAGLDNFAVRLTPKITRETRVVDANVVKQLESMGVPHRASRRLAPMLTGTKKIADNIEAVFENGQRVLYEIKDPYLMSALRSTTPEAFNLAVRIMSGFKNALTLGVTLSPEFMARNLVKDTQIAFVQSRGAFFPIVSSVRGLTKRILKDEDYFLNLANGGGFATTYKGDVQASKVLQVRYRQEGINPKNVADSIEKMIDLVVEYSSVLEESSRLEEFRIVKERTGSLREAAASAREVSTDFAMRGASKGVKNVVATLPFMNAFGESIYRFSRQVKDHPVKTAVKGVLGITIPTLLLYAHNKDDPTYRALSDWVKDNHFVFIAGETVFLVPKGFEVGAIFGAVPERTFEFIEKENGKRFADALLSIFSQSLLVDSVVPQAFRPGDDVLRRNESFLDIPIVPERLKGVSPEEQFTEQTNKVLVELARFIKEDTGVAMSPIQVQALIEGYMGTMGIYFLDGAEQIQRNEQNRRQGGKPEVGGRPEKRWDELPLIRRFIRNTPLKRTSFESEFYVLLGDSRMLGATLNKTVSEGRPGIPRGADAELLGALPILNRVAKQAAEMNVAIRIIARSDKLTPRQKRTQIDKILDARNKLFEGIISGLPEYLLAEKGINP